MFTRFHRSFEPTFHPERLGEPSKLTKPSKIFCCSVADLFAPWTPWEWYEAVIESIEKCPIKHTFQLLTKNPERIPREDYWFPDNVWVGTTVTGENGDWKNIEEIKKVNASVRFVSFEPLLGDMPEGVTLKGVQWIIIGKLTGSRRVRLDPDWVKNILFEASDHNIPLFIKNNVGWPGEKIQNFPKEATG
jgi:protein gp37